MILLTTTTTKSRSLSVGKCQLQCMYVLDVSLFFFQPVSWKRFFFYAFRHIDWRQFTASVMPSMRPMLAAISLKIIMFNHFQMILAKCIVNSNYKFYVYITFRLIKVFSSVLDFRQWYGAILRNFGNACWVRERNRERERVREWCR